MFRTIRGKDVSAYIEIPDDTARLTASGVASAEWKVNQAIC